MTRPLAIVTGAGSGIGAAIAGALAADHDLLLTHLADDDGLAITITDARDKGADVACVSGDLTEPHVQQALAAAVEDQAARIRVLVSNAGAYPRTPWADTTPAGLRRDIEVNLFTHLACLHTVTPAMTANHYGRIIAISSVLTQLARVDLTGYITAKGGLEALIRALARELAPHGITANTVDIAATVAFLASEQARFITGQAITVDGGWHLA